MSPSGIPGVTGAWHIAVFSVAMFWEGHIAGRRGRRSKMKIQQTYRSRSVEFIRAAASLWRGLMFLCVLVASPAVLAQGVTGRIVGTAVDSSGAAIVNAKVTVTNEDTRIS